MDTVHVRLETAVVARSPYLDMIVDDTERFTWKKSEALPRIGGPDGTQLWVFLCGFGTVLYAFGV